MKHRKVWVGVATLYITALAACIDETNEDDNCYSDASCPSGRVCERSSGECEKPQADCLASCQNMAACGREASVDDCVKDACGASFLGYYEDRYGAPCADAWLAVDRCMAALDCEALAQEAAGDGVTSAHCQLALDQKNAACDASASSSSSASTSPGGCTYDDDCGDREICSDGQCRAVACTNDAHCGSCERCTGNSCSYCGEGPYGCYC
jgi:hypothetical protein